MRPPFPQVVDSTLIDAFRSCKQKAFLAHFRHWRKKGGNVHLTAGGALAAGLEAARVAFYRNGAPVEEAIATGFAAAVRKWGDFEAHPDDIKQWDRSMGALEYYFTIWPLGIDKARPHNFGTKSGVEFSFAEPVEGTRHPETGDPIIFVGRADMLADYVGGLFTFDEKTTSRLGPSWAKQWNLRGQFIGYKWGLQKQGYKIAGNVTRGISILTNGYDKAESIDYFADWEVDRWEHELRDTLDEMIACWHKGYWNYNLGSACTQYSGCSYRAVCKHANPNAVLRMDYERVQWDPVRHLEHALGPEGEA